MDDKNFIKIEMKQKKIEKKVIAFVKIYQTISRLNDFMKNLARFDFDTVD